VTNPENMAEEINRVLRAYAADVSRNLEVVTKETAMALAHELKTTSPKRKKHGGAYQKGWTQKKTGKGQNKSVYTVYNKTRYQLTHLLEHGHAKIGGGRVPAYPHIAPAEDKHVREFLAKVERAIQE
jgi:hypothetical protein